MNEWALVSNGAIVDVITTVASRAEVQQQYPHYLVVDLWSLPSKVQEAYHLWRERP